MFTKEVLQTIQRQDLREWARVNGADMNAFDQVEAAWEAANATTAPIISNEQPKE